MHLGNDSFVHEWDSNAWQRTGLVQIWDRRRVVLPNVRCESLHVSQLNVTLWRISLGFQPGWQVFKGRPKSPKGGSGTWAAAVTRRRWLCRVYVGQPFDKQKQILGQKLGELNLYQLLWTFIMKIVSGDRMSAPSQNLRGKNPRLSFCVNLQSKAPTSRKGTGMFYSCV